MVHKLITRKLKQAKQELKDAVVRDFSGGWNMIDDDLNLSSKYARKLVNFSVMADGTVTLRGGVKLLRDLNPFFSSPGARIINNQYFSNAIVVVASNGDVLSVLADGTTTRIWDVAIAAALPGAPSGWSTTTFASFAEFNNDLIICNGVDKPLIVSADLTVDYLQDLATLTNINTPIAKYVVACNRYLVMAGDPVNPYRVHISARDSSGTWYSDPDPNDATFVDVGSILNGASYIRGLGSFRGQLVIGFVEGTIFGRLGEYVVDAHTPQFEDPVEQYGGVSHRSMISYGDDMLLMDLVGVPSLKKTVFTGTLRPERVSDLIDREMGQILDGLTIETVEDRSFAVYCHHSGQFLFFVPSNDDIALNTETKAFVYTYRPNLGVTAWARYDGWNFTCGCETQSGRIVFGDVNGKLWLRGVPGDQYLADYLDDPTIEDGTGVAITFDWELPWSDLNSRAKTKSSRYLLMDTRGTASFNISMYVDRFTLDSVLADAPQLSADFTAGDAGGFGEGDALYGGGNNTAYEKLYAWPAKFIFMKLRIRGSTKEALKIVSVGLLYLRGGYSR